MTSDDLDLDAIEARAAAATPGPWAVRDMGGLEFDVIGFDGWLVAAGDDGSGAADLPDAEFIAHARTDAPAMAARIRFLERELAVSERVSQANANAHMDAERRLTESLVQ